MSKRKDFEQWKVDEVYRLQDGICKNCGKTLIYGFHRHHDDGDCSNNSVGNLTLLCSECHDAQAYASYMKRKKKALADVDGIVKMGIKGELSGAALDKLTDAVKLGLSLTGQVYGLNAEKAPASVRMQDYLITSGILLKEYENGYRKGLNANVAAMIVEMLKPYLAQLNLAKQVKLLNDLLAMKGKPINGKGKKPTNTT